MNTKDKVLLVDDEPNVLDAYRRTLRRKFAISTALGAQEAIEVIKTQGPFSVLVTDMHMPEINGVQLLTFAKKLSPNTVRVMLTGNADQQTAIDAVNKGDIFRFLNKPCSPENLENTLNVAIKQFHLINAEKDLLENTLKGSIETLTEVLSLINPQLFGKTTQLKNQIKECANALGLANVWEMESIAMLSMLGYVALPEEIVQKATSLQPLTAKETAQFRRHPELAAELIGKIPRMEAIAKAVRYQHKHFDGTGFPEDDVKGLDIPLGARVLKPILDYQNYLSSGMDHAQALDQLDKHASHYDARILKVIFNLSNPQSQGVVKNLPVHMLTPAMAVAQDVYVRRGILLVCNGQLLTPSLIERLVNFWRNGEIAEKIAVTIRAEGA